ncbi:DUF1513 domain-containing protein, partial [Myxococcota bacterium]|nr:DUF1513 domain-containing protein [Myxococcota bacterium]
GDNVPLVVVHRGEQELQPLGGSGFDWRPFNQYTGSVALSADGEVAGVTSPRGSLLSFWNTRNGEMISTRKMQDVCGISFNQNRGCFAVTTGFGRVYFLDALGQDLNQPTLSKFENLRCDNHLATISI